MNQWITCFWFSNTIDATTICMVSQKYNVNLIRGRKRAMERGTENMAKSQRTIFTNESGEKTAWYMKYCQLCHQNIDVGSVISAKYSTISIYVRGKRMPCHWVASWLMCEAISHFGLFPLCHTIAGLYWMCNQNTFYTLNQYKYIFFIPQSQHHQTNKFSIHKTLYIFIDDGHCFSIFLSRSLSFDQKKHIARVLT